LPNLDPSMNQQSEEESPKPSIFKNHLLSIRDERQKMIILIVIQYIINVIKKL